MEDWASGWVGGWLACSLTKGPEGKGRCVRGLNWLGGLGAGLVDVGVDGWTDGHMGG